jgi:hypothetical protein
MLNSLLKVRPLAYSDIQQLIKSLNVPSGMSKRFDCVSCGGRNSLGVSNRNGTLSWNCFRASCRTRGRLGTTVTLSDLRSLKLQKDDPPFVLPEYFTYVSNEDAIVWLKRYNCNHAITKKLVEVRYDPRDNRLVFLIKNKQGDLIDAAGRSLTDGSGPKWRRYGRSRYPLVVGRKDNAILVEDAASACAVSGLGTGVCLLGTHLTTEAISAMRDFTSCTIALDPDAKLKALKLQKQLEGYLPTKVALLPDDPKCFTEDQLRSYL